LVTNTFCLTGSGFWDTKAVKERLFDERARTARLPSTGWLSEQPIMAASSPARRIDAKVILHDHDIILILLLGAVPI
jgi:hypothetical protein